MKALNIEGSTSSTTSTRRCVDAVLVDGAHPGSGKTHSWDETAQPLLRRAGHRRRWAESANVGGRR